MLQRYFLVEAINIYNNIFDTDQLSIIRGSSLLLKEAIDAITEKYSDDLFALATGASSGLYQCTENARSSDEIEKSIIKFLNDKKKSHRLFTFAVEYCEADTLFEAKKNLQIQLRINQMQSLSVATDIAKDQMNLPCDIDGRRVQSSNVELVKLQEGDTVKRLSDSLYRRLRKGRDARSSFYFKELQHYAEKIKLNDYSFSKDLESLAKTSQYPKLNNKIAVIYMDGNSFGKIQNELIKNEPANNQAKIQKDFDNKIKNKRAEVLFNILKNMLTDASRFPDALTNQQNEQDKEEKIIRLETLLWGGDEMTFVIPAWLGFEFIQYVFDEFKDWEAETPKLTHAAGIVFCSAKSPIRIMRDLAMELAENIKNNNEVEGRKDNYWDYLILESIDYPSNNNIADYRKAYLKSLGIVALSPLKPITNWQSLKLTLQDLLSTEKLPHGQLYQIIQAIKIDVNNSNDSPSHTWDALSTLETETTSKQEEQEQRLLQVGDNSLKEHLKKVAEGIFGVKNMDDKTQRAQFWVHLIESWDYIIPNKRHKEDKQ